MVSRNGHGKLTAITSYKTTGRGVMGVTTLKITDKTGPVATAHLVQDSATEVIIVSAKGVVMRTPLSEIRSLGRITQGVKIMKPDEDDYVVTATSMNAGHTGFQVGCGPAAYSRSRRYLNRSGWRSIARSRACRITLRMVKMRLRAGAAA